MNPYPTFQNQPVYQSYPQNQPYNPQPYNPQPYVNGQVVNSNPYQQAYPSYPQNNQPVNYAPYGDSKPLYQPYSNPNPNELQYAKTPQNSYPQQNPYAPNGQGYMPQPAPVNSFPTQNQKEEPKPIKYIIHKIEYHDTLDGLSLQYNVSAREIKIFNGLTTEDIYYMKEIKIPNPDLENIHESTVEFDEEAMRKQVKIKALKELMQVEDHKAANYYLDENNWDVDSAYQNYKQDLDFEKKYNQQNGHLQQGATKKYN